MFVLDLQLIIGLRVAISVKNIPSNQEYEHRRKKAIFTQVCEWQYKDPNANVNNNITMEGQINF